MRAVGLCYLALKSDACADGIICENGQCAVEIGEVSDELPRAGLEDLVRLPDD